MAIDVDLERGSIKEVFPHLRILRDPEGPGLEMLEEYCGTCALDVADRNDDGTGTSGLGGVLALREAALSGKPIGQSPGLNIEDTGRRLNLSIERTRQLGSAAIQELRVKLRRLDNELPRARARPSAAKVAVATPNDIAREARGILPLPEQPTASKPAPDEQGAPIVLENAS